MCACSSARKLERQPQKSTKCLHLNLEKILSTALEKLDDLLYLRRAEILLKIIQVPVIHYHYTLKKQTSVFMTKFVVIDSQSNTSFYVLKYLTDGVQQKQPEKWKLDLWMLHHDIAIAHLTLPIWELLTKHNTPPFSLPNLFTTVSI
jgi:hypothetical protein